jgi:hypothetical protein
VALESDGAFVVAWSRSGQIYARRYDSAGAPLSLELKVNTVTLGDHGKPAVSLADSGSFCVVWESDREGVRSLRGRVLNHADVPLGGEFEVTAEQANLPIAPAVALSPRGRAYVSFGKELGGGIDGAFLDSFSFGLFADGFESGNTSAWSASVGVASARR